YYVVLNNTDRAFVASNVSDGADTITLTGHGLKEGAEVVYKKADRFDIAIGGLLADIKYKVHVVDANHIQLKNFEDVTVDLDTSLSTSTGHRLELVNPTIKLAASYADAVSATPHTLALIAAGSGHWFGDALHDGFGTSAVT